MKGRRCTVPSAHHFEWFSNFCESSRHDILYVWHGRVNIGQCCPTSWMLNIISMFALPSPILHFPFISFIFCWFNWFALCTLYGAMFACTHLLSTRVQMCVSSSCCVHHNHCSVLCESSWFTHHVHASIAIITVIHNVLFFCSFSSFVELIAIVGHLIWFQRQYNILYCTQYTSSWRSKTFLMQKTHPSSSSLCTYCIMVNNRLQQGLENWPAIS